MIVTLSDDVSENAEIGIRAYLEREVIENPSLNGVKISIIRDDYISVEGADEITGAQLLAQIHNIITGVDAF